MNTGTVLAFDYGEKRLGVAVGESSLGIAHPVETISAGNDAARMEHVARVVQEWHPVLVIVGLPIHMDDRDHALAARCRRFAEQVTRRFGVATRLIDERLSSDAASESLREAGIRGIKQKAMLDQVAAQHILQTYFSMRDEVT
ncbi:MAG: Holliday junction resolvase RuvX [Betaproteobacteria bacterium]